ncbi:hypothetical protein BDV95DRAFT_610114 [Massariosphaeria phaeospora]|uniref:Uncharacterized protein n=1 Tax=Massariosphaeria phaeospora TaxID=100035 RepID=A0A7C8M7Q0_9PLEO|nr:hypothetical protein BDV95DRAFT_610114 [Massariosphaeria phaeospora]
MKSSPTPRLSHPTNPKPTRISECSNLTITLTIEPNTKRQTKYRVVQRPDGVIVESPRYRPSRASSLAAIKDFRPPPVALDLHRRGYALKKKEIEVVSLTCRV